MSSQVNGLVGESHSKLILPGNIGDVGATHPDTPVMGPGSLMWKHAGRRYNTLPALAFGFVEEMHPIISAVLLERSDFFENPTDRLLRSIDPIQGTIYDPEPETTGHEQVRDQHKDFTVTYTTKEGEEKKSHALSKDPFGFAQYTFHMMVKTGYVNYNTDERPVDWEEQLWQGSRVWYSRYGVSMDPLPADRAEGEEIWQDYLLNKLEWTPAAQETYERAQARDIGRPSNIRPEVWNVIEKFASEIARLVIIDGTPEALRERFDIPPLTPADKRRLERFEKLVKASAALDPILPKRLTRFKRAREGMNAPNRQAPVTYAQALALN